MKCVQRIVTLAAVVGAFTPTTSKVSSNRGQGLEAQPGRRSRNTYDIFQELSEAPQPQPPVVDLLATELGLLRANQNFYAAFRAGDFDMLCQCLHPDECVSVIHPGIPPLYGRKAVIQSWYSVLKFPPHIVASEPRVVQINDQVAWLHCFETLEGTNGSLIRLAATNIFKRDRHNQWKIVLHHAGSCM